MGATPFSFANLKRLSMGMLCAKFGWNPSSGSWEEVENVKTYNWSLFCPLKGPKGGTGIFFMQTSVLHHWGMLCTKFGWNRLKLNFPPFSATPSGAVYDPISFSFANFVDLALRTLNIKYEVIWTSGSWEEDFLRFTQFLPLLPPPGPPMGSTPFSFANLKQLPMGMLCAKFGWNPSSGSWEEVENVKD